MRHLKAKIPRVAASPFPVVIEGESGTGRELIARAIHEEGPRGGAVFVPVNCAVLGDELFESELFGHAKGAFHPARRRTARGCSMCRRAVANAWSSRGTSAPPSTTSSPLMPVGRVDLMVLRCR